MALPAYLAPEHFLADLFAAKAARQGGVIRRKRRDIERFYGVEAFLEEMRRRGFGVVENAGQFVIFCNQEPIKRLA
ncbi:N-(5'-phosphoribosyl)anthranilate isomerase [Oceaniglobus roseus]|uniref:N-(5'-phosphoribosyl)anthranilate isomerase n=1 Tax=Oceaniglobus roseus TaxID=1737570 RepID=UPI000C7F36BA|nr:N-(5'-phosphoribosyl)anthranilate isomerase [Kandeliimicrobium roseum]